MMTYQAPAQAAALRPRMTLRIVGRNGKFAQGGEVMVVDVLEVRSVPCSECEHCAIAGWIKLT